MELLPHTQQLILRMLIEHRDGNIVEVTDGMMSNLMMSHKVYYAQMTHLIRKGHCKRIKNRHFILHPDWTESDFYEDDLEEYEETESK